MAKNIRLFALILLTLIYTSPATATTLRPAETTCPLRGETFFAVAVMSWNSLGGVDTDNFSRPSGYLPQSYAIYTCPYDGFSAYGEDFGAIAEIPEGVSAKLILPELSPDDRLSESSQSFIPFWIKIENAATYYQSIGKDPEFMGNLYLLGSGLARMEASSIDTSMTTATYSCFIRNLKKYDFLRKYFNREDEWKQNTLIGQAIIQCADMHILLSPNEALLAAEFFRDAGHHNTSKSIIDNLPVLNDQAVEAAKERMLFLIDKERKYQDKAAAYFETALRSLKSSEEKYTEKKNELLYIIGEENRRLGNFEKAKMCFDEIIKNNGEADPEGIYSTEYLTKLLSSTEPVIPVEAIKRTDVVESISPDNVSIKRTDQSRDITMSHDDYVDMIYFYEDLIDSQIQYQPAIQSIAIKTAGLRIYNLKKQETSANIRPFYPIVTYAISGNGKTLAYISSGQKEFNEFITTITIVDIESGSKIAERAFRPAFIAQNAIARLNFKGDTIAISGIISYKGDSFRDVFFTEPNTLMVLDAATLETLYDGYASLSRAPLTSIEFSFDDKFLLTGGYDNAIKVWDVATMTPTKLRKYKRPFDSLIMGPGSSEYSITDGNVIGTFSLETGAFLRDYPELPWKISHFSFSSDAKYVAASKNCGHDAVFMARNNRQNKTICHNAAVINIETGEIRGILTGHKIIDQINFSNGNKYVRTSDLIGGITKFWDIEDLHEASYLADLADAGWILIETDTGNFACSDCLNENGVIQNEVIAYLKGRAFQVPQETYYDATITQKYFNLVDKGQAVTPEYYFYKQTADSWSPLDSEEKKYAKKSGDDFYDNSDALDYCETAGKPQSDCTDSGHISGNRGVARIVPQFGHANSINDIKFSSDGKTIATAGSDFTIQIWDSATYNILCLMNTGIRNPLKIDFQKDSPLLASGYSDGYIGIWDSANCARVAEFKPHSGEITDIRFLPEDIITSGMDGNIIISRMNNDRTIETIKTLHAHEGGVTSMNVSAKLDKIVSGGHDKHIKVWTDNLSNIIQDIDADGNIPDTVMFSTDNASVYSCTANKSISKWKIKDASFLGSIKPFPGSPQYCSFVFADDNKKIVIPSYSDILSYPIIEPSTFDSGDNLPPTLRTCSVDGMELGRITSLASGKGGKVAVTGNANRLEIHDINSELPLFSGDMGLLIPGSPDYVSYLSNTDDIPLHEYLISIDIKKIENKKSALGNIFASSQSTIEWNSIFNSDKTIKIKTRGTNIFLTSTISREVIKKYHHSPSLSIHGVTPDDSAIIASDKMGNIVLLSFATGDEIGVLKGHDTIVSKIDVNKTGDLLASYSKDNVLKVWDIKENKFITTVGPLPSSFLSFAFLSNGNTILTSCNNGRMYIWDARSGELKATYVLLHGGEWVVYTEDGYFGSTLENEKIIHSLIKWKIGNELVAPCDLYKSRRNDNLLLELLGLQASDK